MEPPEHLREDLRRVWTQIVDQMPTTRRINPIRLEAYCEQVQILRDASYKVIEEGLTIQDATGRTVRNPATDIIQGMQKALSAWGDEFAPASVIRRRRGPMYDATRKSVAAADHLKDKDEFSGPVEAVCTLAWLIDEAQRAGIEELQKAAFGTIPTYLKACAALQITPADRPDVAKKPTSGSGRKGKLAALQGGIAS
ncbi:MAG: P27 family phage terminase small subunit [Micrococcus sp.]|nr:P27 family phage terminase small subunit [Micrococcus sp.]